MSCDKTFQVGKWTREGPFLPVWAWGILRMTSELSLKRGKAEECLTLEEKRWIPDTLQGKSMGLDRSQRTERR